MGIGVLIFALLSPTTFADQFTVFDFGEGSTPTSFGNFEAVHDVRAGTGTMNLYASATVVGGADVLGRIGATYSLNTGDLLAPFEAFTTTEGTAVGELACLNIGPGTEASLTMTLQKWRQEGTDWVHEETAFVDEWRCPLVNLVDFEAFSGGGTFSYSPGESYRVLAEGLARTRAFNGSEAVSDFCDSTAFGCGPLTVPGHIIIDLIEIPNQRPVALFHDTEVWFVDGFLTGVAVTGRSCDIDGSVASIRVWVTELITETTTPVNAICGDGQHVVAVVAPGTFTGNAEGRDDEGATGNDVGIFRVSLLPPVPPSPLGLPALASLPPRSSATFSASLDSAGEIQAYRLTIDGAVVADTMPGALPGAHAASVTYDVEGAWASVVIDGLERWSGPVAPPLGPGGWWDIEPVGLPALPVI